METRRGHRRQRRSRRASRRLGDGTALTRRQRLALVLAATLALLGGGLVVGAFLLQRTTRRAASPRRRRRPDARVPGPGGITVSLVQTDGRRASSATFDRGRSSARTYATVPGSPSRPTATWRSRYRRPAGTSEYRIVDLRDPSLPPRTSRMPRRCSAPGVPDDRFAMPVNAAASWSTTPIPALEPTQLGGRWPPRDIMFRPAWALDGVGLLANGGDAGPTSFGVLEQDGSFVAGRRARVPGRRRDATHRPRWRSAAVRHRARTTAARTR